jgi:hypothetical protein
VPASPRRIRPT